MAQKFNQEPQDHAKKFLVAYAKALEKRDF
jgi:hypothetical protein